MDYMNGSESEAPGEEEVLAELYVYKSTAVGDLVVKRYFCLRPGKFYTYHDWEKNPKDYKKWSLDKGCKLEPPNADNITGYKKLVRPQGMWTATATVRGGGESVMLHCFVISWPTSWAAKGYTSMTLGVEDWEEAKRLHLLINHQINQLKWRRSTSCKGDRISGTMKVSLTPRSNSCSQGSETRGLMDDTAPFMTTQTNMGGDDCCTGPDSETSVDESCSSELVPEEPERWVPYRHTNGVAIYYHRDKEDEEGYSSEYMASSIVRGSPEECLSVLLDSRSHTTILGPATHVDLLESTEDRQVLRIEIEATGMARQLCAPREFLVQTMIKREDFGVVVVLFSSVERMLVHDSSRPKPWWWYRPVRGSVRGGFTISPLEDYGSTPTKSPESLVTCILKVDLGGSCGEHSWLRLVPESMGWADAYIERMLMSVILVKDALEQRRFVVPPFTMFGNHIEERGRRGSKTTTMKRTSTMIVKDRGTRKRKQPLRRTKLPSLARDLGSLCPDSQMTTKKDGSMIGDDVPISQLASLPQRFWSELHAPGTAAPFKVRGPNYLHDNKKIDAGPAELVLAAVELVITDKPTEHISRYLPTVRCNPSAFSFVINLIIPGTPILSLCAVFSTSQHPDTLDDDSDLQPFENCMRRFMHGSDDERSNMFKLIPHIADGSWVIKQSVGTTPVIMGRKLRTTYHCTPRYMEVDIDVSSSSPGAYITGMVRGATKSLVIDLGFVLEGQHDRELPESILGAFRLHNLDLDAATRLNTSVEIPLAPPRQSKVNLDGLSSPSLGSGDTDKDKISVKAHEQEEEAHAAAWGSRGTPPKPRTLVDVFPQSSPGQATDASQSFLASPFTNASRAPKVSLASKGHRRPTKSDDHCTSGCIDIFRSDSRSRLLELKSVRSFGEDLTLLEKEEQNKGSRHRRNATADQLIMSLSEVSHHHVHKSSVGGVSKGKIY